MRRLPTLPLVMAAVVLLAGCGFKTITANAHVTVPNRSQPTNIDAGWTIEYFKVGDPATNRIQ